MGGEQAAVGPMEGWNAWEELILGAAVLRHGEHDWNVVASELQARTRYPTLFTPEACKNKYEDLLKRYSGSRVWFEELRKQCVAELKQELARSEASIGFLESKIKYMEKEKQNSDQGDYACSQTESPLPTSVSSSKKISKDEQSAGSYTIDTSTRTSSLSEHHHQETKIYTKIHASVSSEHDKYSSIENQAVAGAITRKRRGQRKRKDCNPPIKEGSVGESDNLGSSNAVFTSHKEALASTPGYDQVKDSSTKRNTLMEIFQSIAKSEPASVFRQRLDSQKRARYRKIIRQHVDITTIRSRIIGKSIKSAKELFRDLLLLATNALVFYSSRTREYKSAFSLRNLVMKEYKQHCRASGHEATSAFLPFNRHVKPRSARLYLPPPGKEKVLEKLSGVDNVVPAKKPKALVQTCDSETKVSQHSLVKSKKGLKRPGERKPGSANTQPECSLGRQRKRISK